MTIQNFKPPQMTKEAKAKQKRKQKPNKTKKSKNPIETL